VVRALIGTLAGFGLIVSDGAHNPGTARSGSPASNGSGMPSQVTVRP
jgi:hypothetical protein